jgi:DNA invertase Pin-like site-specific DNA recombinase
MIYGYARVSSKEQHLDRQLEELKKHVKPIYIYIDRQSGKDFERTNYKKMIKKLKKGDLLIIKSIDRLGRNYDLILEEWRYITKEIGADIKVLDLPLLDTSKTEGLTGKLISDLVLQILSYVAEQERVFIKQRQAEGIKIAKEKGILFGRPRKLYSFDEWAFAYLEGKIQSKEAIARANVSRGTFFTRLKEIRANDKN